MLHNIYIYNTLIEYKNLIPWCFGSNDSFFRRIWKNIFLMKKMMPFLYFLYFIYFIMFKVSSKPPVLSIYDTVRMIQISPSWMHSHYYIVLQSCTSMHEWNYYLGSSIHCTTGFNRWIVGGSSSQLLHNQRIYPTIQFAQDSDLLGWDVRSRFGLPD